MVHFVEGHPIFDFTLQCIDHRFDKLQMEVNDFAVLPRIIIRYQVHRQFKMIQSNDRLDVVFQ